MNDKLLCPFCNKPLQPTHRIEDEYFCENYDCPQTSITWIGTSSLWKAFADTKKKLDVAVDALKEINDRYESEEQRGREEDDSPDWWDFSMDTGEILAKAIEQITALEQKDVK